MLVKLSEGKNVCILGNEVRMVASLYGGVAQLVEQKTFNLLVGGSSPLTLTIYITRIYSPVAVVAKWDGRCG